ncbi:hypothetical protein ACWPKO_12050 [Coraliomargarita sp. W4R53]
MARIIKKIKRKFRQYLYMRDGICSTQVASKQVSDAINRRIPFAIGKIGNVESNAIVFNDSHAPAAISSTSEWGKIGYKLYKNAGVFPQDSAAYQQFCSSYTEALKQMDLLGVWYHETERGVIKRHASKARLSNLQMLSPDPSLPLSESWSQQLEGKRILVIHPFTQTIESQYKRRSKIWPQSPHILPKFELITLKTPLADSISPSPYPDWQTALIDLKQQMSSIDFDVALIGAGAWSLPLTAHAKSLGKIGIHTGGATQLFFGIKGNRWEKHQEPSFYNEHWTRPCPSETPENAHTIEKACYW